MTGNVLFETTWTCAAEGCQSKGQTRHVESVFQVLDRSCPAVKESLPEGWQEVEGRVYCPAHDIEVVARIRTPVVARMDGRFVAGEMDEIIRLRKHIATEEDRVLFGPVRIGR